MERRNMILLKNVDDEHDERDEEEGDEVPARVVEYIKCKATDDIGDIDNIDDE